MIHPAHAWSTFCTAGIAYAAPLAGAIALWPFRKRADQESPESAATVSPEDNINLVLDLVEWGIRLGESGKPELAAQRLARAIKNDPNDAAAHYNLGLVLDQMEQFSEAAESFARAAGIAPDFADARINLGAALLASGDSDGAVREFRAAVEHAPDDPAAWHGLGCAQFANGNYQEAVEAFRQALKLDADDPELRFNLGVALRRAGYADLAAIELRVFLDMAADRWPRQRDYAQRVVAAESHSKEAPNGNQNP